MLLLHLLRRKLRLGLRDATALVKHVHGQARTKYTDSSGYTHFSRTGRGGSLSSSASSNRLLYGAAAAVASGGTLVYLGYSETIPYTKRTHLVLISPEQERKLGAKMYRDLLSQQRRSGKLLPSHHKLTRIVRKVGSKVAKETEALSDWGGQVSHMRDMKWEFNVINSDEVNAFVLPGGKVIVYAGLFKVLKSEEELAMVMAHEIGHAVARHSAEKITQQMTMTVLRTLLFLALGADIASTPLVLGLQLPYSRLAENEADAIGLQLMARACFDPSHGPKAMERLSAGNSIPEYLSTHPHSATRSKQLRNQLPDAYEVFEARCFNSRNFFGQILK